MKKIVALICICALALSCTGCMSILEKVMQKETEPPATMAPETAPPEPVRTEMSVPDLAEYVQSCTYTIVAENEEMESSGSGFLVDGEGTLVTSYHVIDAADSIMAKDRDGAIYTVESIIDFDVNHDIAVLKLSISGHDYLKIAEEPTRTGEAVYAVGAPMGLSETFSNGIVSNSDRKVGLIDCLQITASISPGNSGGPLVNSFGEVIGINAFSYASGNDLNLAVKINELELLNMDKNWSINQYREWYKKEIERSYKVWNNSSLQFELSKINTYHHVTGRTCMASAFDWELTGLKEGYDDQYGVYVYEYDVAEFDEYTAYLNSIGFEFNTGKDYTEGTSYYYINEFTGYQVDIFVVTDENFVVIEPYCY